MAIMNPESLNEMIKLELSRDQIWSLHDQLNHFVNTLDAEIERSDDDLQKEILRPIRKKANKLLEMIEPIM